MINELTAILDVPISAFEVPSPSEWIRVNSSLGQLPVDYYDFLRSYGSGSIGDFIWIFNPSSANEWLNLETQVIAQSYAMELVRIGGEDIPYKLYPEQRGLLPFGRTDNGDTLWWKRDGQPDHWSVVVAESRAPEWEEFPMCVTAFLAGIISQRIKCRIFPDSFPPIVCKFRPSS